MDRSVEDVAVQLAEVNGKVDTLTAEVAGMRREVGLMVQGADGNATQKHLLLTQRVQGLEAKMVLHDSTFTEIERTLNTVQYGIPAARRMRITDRGFVIVGTLTAAGFGALISHLLAH